MLVGDWLETTVDYSAAEDPVEMIVDTWAEENRIEVAADKAAEDQFEMIVDILGNMMVAD